jgi:hypothetical protein
MHIITAMYTSLRPELFFNAPTIMMPAVENKVEDELLKKLVQTFLRAQLGIN